MTEWQPIEKYAAMKRKPQLVLFRFAPVVNERRDDLSLRATYQFSRSFGYRTCTHFKVIDPLPEDVA